jgi:hypothetical protein
MKDTLTWWFKMTDWELAWTMVLIWVFCTSLMIVFQGDDHDTTRD